MVKGGIDLLTHVMSMRPLLASMREIRMGKLVYFPESERGTSCHVLTLPRSRSKVIGLELRHPARLGDAVTGLLQTAAAMAMAISSRLAGFFCWAAWFLSR